MNYEEVVAREILGYGAYLCGRRRNDDDIRTLAGAPVAALADRLGLHNEFNPAASPPAESIAFLSRCSAAPGDITDAGVAEAEWIVHVAARSREKVADFCAQARKLLEPAAQTRIMGGVRQPRKYTGAAMNHWAYARAVVQQPGTVMPNAFLVPLSKTAEWWGKDWMERHTYFLPRYDDAGRMIKEGHSLVCAAGIPCLLRRTYYSETHPAPDGAYDFVSYFECGDADVPVFHQVCANLRDVKRNPEWKFVREGPRWHGRRVPTWEALFVADGRAAQAPTPR